MKRFIEDAGPNRERRGGVLGTHIDSSAKARVEAGYAASSVQSYRRVVTNFDRWLSQGDLAVGDIDEQVIDAYLEERRREASIHRSRAAALRHLLGHLRNRGVVLQPVPGPKGCPVDRLVTRYEDHLRSVRGLTEATAVNYRPSVYAFLHEQFGDGPLRLRDLKSADVTKFLLRQAHSLSHMRAQLMTTALRSLFRFLLQYGEIEVDLAAAVLPVARRQPILV